MALEIIKSIFSKNKPLDEGGFLDKQSRLKSYENLTPAHVQEILKIIQLELEVSKKFGLELEEKEIDTQTDIILAVFDKNAPSIIEQGSNWGNKEYQSFLFELIEEVYSQLGDTLRKYFEIFKEKGEVTSKYELHIQDIMVLIYRYLIN